MTNEHPKRRRWFQFSVRTLLITVLVLSLPLSWFAVRMARARRQKAAVQTLEELGGGVLYDWEISTIAGRDALSLGEKKTTPWMREYFGQDIDPVVSIELFGVKDEVDLKCVEDLNGALSFFMANSRIGDGELEHLSGLRNLQSICMRGSPIRDEDLRHLGDLPDLANLDLQDTGISDDALAHLASLPNLKRLDLSRNPITDAGLKHLEDFISHPAVIVDSPITPEAVDKARKAVPEIKLFYIIKYD